MCITNRAPLCCYHLCVATSRVEWGPSNMGLFLNRKNNMSKENNGDPFWNKFTHTKSVNQICGRIYRGSALMPVTREAKLLGTRYHNTTPHKQVTAKRKFLIGYPKKVPPPSIFSASDNKLLDKWHSNTSLDRAMNRLARCYTSSRKIGRVTPPHAHATPLFNPPFDELLKESTNVWQLACPMNSRSTRTSGHPLVIRDLSQLYNIDLGASASSCSLISNPRRWIRCFQDWLLLLHTHSRWMELVSNGGDHS